MSKTIKEATTTSRSETEDKLHTWKLRKTKALHMQRDRATRHKYEIAHFKRLTTGE